MQAIYGRIAMLRSWSSVQSVENQDQLMEVSTRLEDTARGNVIKHGWQRDLWICPSPPYVL
jgi:hypothetical protein